MDKPPTPPQPTRVSQAEPRDKLQDAIKHDLKSEKQIRFVLEEYGEKLTPEQRSDYQRALDEVVAERIAFCDFLLANQASVVPGSATSQNPVMQVPNPPVSVVALLRDIVYATVPGALPSCILFPLIKQYFPALLEGEHTLSLYGAIPAVVQEELRHLLQRLPLSLHETFYCPPILFTVTTPPQCPTCGGTERGVVSGDDDWKFFASLPNLVYGLDGKPVSTAVKPTFQPTHVRPPEIPPHFPLTGNLVKLSPSIGLCVSCLEKTSVEPPGAALVPAFLGTVEVLRPVATPQSVLAPYHDLFSAVREANLQKILAQVAKLPSSFAPDEVVKGSLIELLLQIIGIQDGSCYRSLTMFLAMLRVPGLVKWETPDFGPLKVALDGIVLFGFAKGDDGNVTWLSLLYSVCSYYNKDPLPYLESYIRASELSASWSWEDEDGLFSDAILRRDHSLVRFLRGCGYDKRSLCRLYDAWPTNSNLPEVPRIAILVTAFADFAPAGSALLAHYERFRHALQACQFQLVERQLTASFGLGYLWTFVDEQLRQIPGPKVVIFYYNGHGAEVNNFPIISTEPPASLDAILPIVRSMTELNPPVTGKSANIFILEHCRGAITYEDKDISLLPPQLRRLHDLKYKVLFPANSIRIRATQSNYFCGGGVLTSALANNFRRGVAFHEAVRAALATVERVTLHGGAEAGRPDCTFESDFPSWEL